MKFSSTIEKAQSIFDNNIVLAFCFSSIFNFLVYPTILLFVESPMLATSWTLQDPVVGLLNFIPGISAFRFELFENGNFLWSSLRNLGTPTLANEIQAAPMFPLTLALIWIPDPYFWNAFVSMRTIFLGAGVFLVATHLMRLKPFPAMIFTIVFAYSVFVCRWLNHPWQNGLLAGIWLIYFSGVAIKLSLEPWGRRRLFNMLGITASVYSLVTCGFPEAAAMSALLCTLVVGPMFVVHAFKQPRAARVFLLDCGFAGITGAMLASFQIFALLEYVSLVGQPFREKHGLDQFTSFEPFLMMIARFENAAPPGPMVHIFGFVSLVLFSMGVIARLLKPKVLGVADAIGLLTIVFIVLKFFPVWPAFNRLVASLPLLQESWFTVYFFSIFLFGFAYFCARGMDFIALKLILRRSGTLVMVSAISVIGVITLAIIAGRHFHEIKLSWLSYSILIFVAFLFGIALLYGSNVCTLVRTDHAINVLGVGVVLLLALECYIDKPVDFIAYNSEQYREVADRDKLGQAIVEEAARRAITSHNIRESSNSGWYVGAGVATIDNGAPAIVTQRSRLFRTKLFETDWDGYLPLRSELVRGAYRVAGRNIIVSSTARKQTDIGVVVWNEISGKTIQFDTFSPGRAFVSRSCREVSSPAEAAAVIKNATEFRPGDIVIEKLTGSEAADCKAFQRPTWNTIAVLEDRGTTVRLAAVPGPSVLTLNDSIYPGWTAHDLVSGATLELKPTNINFKSVFLPEARSYEIEFRYRPYWLTLAQILAVVAIIAWLFLASIPIRKQRHLQIKHVGSTSSAYQQA